MESILISPYIEKVFETQDEYSDWFGYYNYDPLDIHHTKMLCNRATFDARSIEAQDQIELGWYDIPSGKWNHIGNTNSFNWQQGAMLQWVPGQSNKVIYNTTDGNHYISVLYDLKSGEQKKISWPIYGLTPDGRKAVSLNYERSYWCRAYHYQPIRNSQYDVPVAEDDGIFLVDLEKNCVKRIVPIQEVINIDYDPSFADKRHWLEHIMINNEGTRIVFLHRFSGENVYEYGTRVVLCDINGNNLQVVPGWRENNWSHVGWINENSFAVFAVRIGSYSAKNAGKKHGALYTFAKTIYKKHLSPILGKSITSKIESGHEYQVYEIGSNQITKKDTFSGNIGIIDGHPSFTIDGLMITDTYPDKEHFQHLQVYSPVTRKCLELGKFLAPLEGNPASCDLHPKLSRNNEFLMVDTAYSGKHHMILFRLNWKRIKEELE